MGYRQGDKQRHNYVTYLLEGERESDLQESQACYHYLFGTRIAEKWKSMLLKEDMTWVPYQETEVKRWVDDLTEVGFPCHFEGMDDTLRIRLVFSEYNAKLQLCSALQLLRCLWEDGVNVIPEIYFEAMDANPQADKLEEIQNAHKSERLEKHIQGGRMHGYTWLPEGHMVTFPHNGRKNVSKALLLERLAQGIGVYDEGHYGHGGINTAWRSPESKINKEYQYE